MIKSLLKTIKTARVVKMEAQCSYSTINRKQIEVIVTAQTKSKDVPETETQPKIDLSKFKLETKRKIQTGTSDCTNKRKHILMKYDETSSSDNNSEASTLKTEPNSEEGPPNWEEILINIRMMRKNFDAPVDSMGCDQCPDEKASHKDKRFQSLLSLMLSSQTKDQVTHAAMLRLRRHGCSLTKILQTTDEKLGGLIYPVSFWKTKVKHIKRTTEMIRDNFNGEIPNTVEDLCKLPGVGPKMAHLCMQIAWNKVTGIGVDTHVHRISNRLGWVNTKNPENTRKALETWLPYNLWSEIGLILVGFGQQICLPVRPKCTTCLNNKLCPFGQVELAKK